MEVSQWVSVCQAKQAGFLTTLSVGREVSVGTGKPQKLVGVMWAQAKLAKLVRTPSGCGVGTGKVSKVS